MRALLERLSPLERTAWNDASCRAVLQARGVAGVTDSFAAWLDDACGPSPAAAGLDRLVPVGVAARRRAVDRALRDILARLDAAHLSCEIWLLGAGLDAGWTTGERPDGRAVAAVREIDLPGLTDAKAQLLDRFGRAPARPVTRAAVDLAASPEALPQTERPVLAVAEGLLDHLAVEPRGRLLRALAGAAPAVVLLADGLSRAGARLDNRRPERFTGDAGLPFADPPPDLPAFHGRCGWSTRAEVPLFPEMARVLGERRRLWRGIAALPWPAPLRRLYALYRLEAGEALP